MLFSIYRIIIFHFVPIVPRYNGDDDDDDDNGHMDSIRFSSCGITIALSHLRRRVANWSCSIPFDGSLVVCIKCTTMFL
jgi:hypothetical protein